MPPPPPPPVAGAKAAARYCEQNAKAVVIRRPLWEDKFPVHAAAQENRVDWLAALLPARRGRALPLRSSEAPVNRKDEDTWTPAHYACYYGHASILRELLLQGADVRAVNVNGCGLLQFAAGQGHEQCALLLLGAGADARHEDEDRNTPASLARQLRPSRWQLLEMLCLLCRDFLPVCAGSTCTCRGGGSCELRVVGFEPRRRHTLTAELRWPVESSQSMHVPEPDSEPEPEPEPEPQVLDPVALATTLLRPVRELKQLLCEEGAPGWAGLLEKHELAERIVMLQQQQDQDLAQQSGDDGSEEGVPPLLQAAAQGLAAALNA